MHRWLDAVLDGPVAARADRAGGPARTRTPHSDALGQKLLALTVPGIPDVYQGTELWEDSLVDPDNRRPVDYAARGGRAGTPAASQDSGRHRGAAAAARPPGHLPVRRLPAGARHRRRPPTTSSRSAAATTCWSRSPGGRSGWPKPAGVTRFCRCRTASWTDRLTGATASGPTPAGRAVRRTAGRAAGEDGCLNSRCGRRCPQLVRLDVDGTLHAMTRSRRRLVARRPSTCAPDARYGFVLDDDPTVLPDPRSPRQPDGVHERSQLWDAAPARVDRRRLGRPLDRGRGDLRAARRHLHRRRARSTPPSRSWTTWSISASTSSS